jgi:HSP20 family protein
MAMERWRPRWGLTPWRPIRDMEEMERRFDELFGRPLLPATWRRLPLEERGWAPAIEVFEKGDKFVIKAEVPGMKEEDVDVSVVGDTLTIRGEKKAESEVSEEDYYCCERSYGSFFRSIALPSTVDAKKIEASYEDGVLEVTLSKAAEVKPKKVPISAKKVTSAKKPSSTSKKGKTGK